MEMNELQESERLPYETRKREWLYCLGMGIVALCLANFVLYGGFHLGFALGTVALTVLTALYLLSQGHRLSWYSGSLLVLSLIIAAGFARSDDGFVKFVLFCFLLVAENLGLCLLSGKNLRRPEGFLSLLDSFRALFSLGLGQIPWSLKGLGASAKNSGKAGKVGGSLARGLLIALPLLAVVIALLTSADAAFSGLMDLLPDFDGAEIFGTVFFGAMAFCWIYTRGTALHHAQTLPTEEKHRKGVQSLTVNTVLGSLCLVYLVYLFSQLAYVVGAFAGILPEGYTMAEYARRGFFEMAWLSGINLATVSVAVGVVEKGEKTPLSTRVLCLFISLIILFFVISGSVKMGMYIAAYGLTRLRVLTEVIMIFLAVTTVLVAVWLFVPKLPYMKIVILVGLVMGATLLWADVDTVVAAYNVGAYQSGKLGSVDVWYLAELSDGVVPYLEELVHDSDPIVASAARGILGRRAVALSEDFRGWNYVNSVAAEILQSYWGG